jgi:chorismate mutase
MKTINKANPLIIAGPCAAESEAQILASIQQVKKRNVDFMRISLWKPRTKPGFEGLGEEGIDLLVTAAKAGIHPGTEVILPDHAKRVMDRVLSEVSDTKLLLWIGARNQNHYIQREIAKIAAADKRVYLMVKNQPWVSEDHWEGIVGHVLDGGISEDRLILCHRGFIPQGENPSGYRNMPDFAMAKRIKEKTNLPMIFDPSHAGGSVPNVIQLAKEATAHDFHGVIVEVHTNPKEALTDANQQLTWEQFDEVAAAMQEHTL